MRVQTYAIWDHHHESPAQGQASARPLDDLSEFIDGLIAQVTYYPSYIAQISPDTQGLVIAGTQRVVQTEEQPDGMVALRTEGRNLWVTHADYQRLRA
jgi:hypothetical protein